MASNSKHSMIFLVPLMLYVPFLLPEITFTLPLGRFLCSRPEFKHVLLCESFLFPGPALTCGSVPLIEKEGHGTVKKYQYRLQVRKPRVQILAVPPGQQHQPEESLILWCSFLYMKVDAGDHSQKIEDLNH